MNRALRLLIVDSDAILATGLVCELASRTIDAQRLSSGLEARPAAAGCIGLAPASASSSFLISAARSYVYGHREPGEPGVQESLSLGTDFLNIVHRGLMISRAGRCELPWRSAAFGGIVAKKGFRMFLQPQFGFA